MSLEHGSGAKGIRELGVFGELGVDGDHLDAGHGASIIGDNVLGIVISPDSQGVTGLEA